MAQDLEKKAEELLDEKTEDKDKDEDSKESKQEKSVEAPEDPIEQLRRLCRGKMKLMIPIRSHGQDVTEIEFDFCALTGVEMMNALDTVPANNIFAISNAQAMALFAAAAEKCAPWVEDGGMRSKLYDGKDIRDRLSAPDFTAALRIAKLFYNASGQAGNNNISKE
ncbi:MAG: hypothetical protein IJ188_06395 [Clostridia bacterium]|nr:hypothetical protein [Clostridia bacterium]